jgi:predicted CoA-binding protein
MSNIIPIRPNLRSDVDEAAVTEQVEQIPGELNMDRVIKAQLAAPQIARRIAELEDCLWAAAQELLRFDPRSASAEQAKLLLKNRLEIDVDET